MRKIGKVKKLLKNGNKYMKKTMNTKYKIWNAKQMVHLKAVRKRRKKVEKNIDRLLIAACAAVCLLAALMEANVIPGSKE